MLFSPRLVETNSMNNLHTENGNIQTDGDSNQIEYFGNGENNKLFTQIEFDKVLKGLKRIKQKEVIPYLMKCYKVHQKLF